MLKESLDYITEEIRIDGLVQGVGFRPFCVRCALESNIFGYVLNYANGVKIIAQGSKEALLRFHKLLQNPPKVAKITHFSFKPCVESQKFCDFSIKKSDKEGFLSTKIPADIAMCEACLSEFLDSKNRRFLYPFTSCTDCGARYSIIESLPYDRAFTSMAKFSMCKTCLDEYNNPHSRRFRSEINCCKDCGPKLYFADFLESFKENIKNLDDFSFCEKYKNLSKNAFKKAIEALRKGKILAIKGIGGYALVCNALNMESLKILRERKRRHTKPFALMCKDLAMAENFVYLNKFEKEILTSKKAPILLAKSKPDSNLPLDLIAPNLANLGVILPYAPLHHLLFSEINFPLIFTSANVSGEPIIKDFSKIVESLSGVCDGVLLFNRNILNAVDDSVVHFVANKERVLRRARGYLSDISDFLEVESKESIFAFGAQQKSTFTYKTKQNLLLSSHLGDLEAPCSVEHFKSVRAFFTRQFKEIPTTFCFDLHPNYTQRKFLDSSCENVFIQHHFAHFLANIYENRICESTLGVIFDGTGAGSDGSIWGGEFLEWNPKVPCEFKRVATFTPLVLFGGEVAIRDIRRLGLSALFAAYGERCAELELEILGKFSKIEFDIFYQMQQKGEILCHSVGRLFDAISAICGVESVSYDGEGGAILETLAIRAKDSGAVGVAYEFSNTSKNPINIFIKDIIRGVCNDLQQGVTKGQIALNFHITLAKIIAKIADGYESIALSGGVFCNALLVELTLNELKGKKVHLHSKIPSNDGGISVGQIHYAMLKAES